MLHSVRSDPSFTKRSGDMVSSERSVKDVSGLYNLFNGGGGGIRTPETLSGLTVFKTAAFNHSATPPH